MHGNRILVCIFGNLSGGKSLLTYKTTDPQGLDYMIYMPMNTSLLSYSGCKNGNKGLNTSPRHMFLIENLSVRVRQIKEGGKNSGDRGYSTSIKGHE